MHSGTGVNGRIASIARFAEARGLDQYLVPSSDEHLNEYVPPWRCRRAFASNFDGSAGDLLVGRSGARLFTDGRYHIQARRQLQGTDIELVPVGRAGSPSLVEYLAEGGGRVGVDPMVVSNAAAGVLRDALAGGGGELVALDVNPVDEIWRDRPLPPVTKLHTLPSQWTGQTSEAKVRLLRDRLVEHEVQAFVTSKLDQIAWLLNFRSADDVPFNPVFEAHLLFVREEAHLFLNGGATRLPAELPGWTVHAYERFHDFLAQCAGERVLADPEGTSWGVVDLVERCGGTLVSAASPIEAAKATKNSAEQECMARANLRASAAKTRSLLWLREAVRSGVPVTEAIFRDRLEADYASLEGHWGLSFGTISAAGAHSAIAHYGTCDDTPLRTGELFLIDSGVHNGGGTTDDTRTVAVGTADPVARRVYTLVLKGHIQAAMARFPVGTPGTEIDALARGPLLAEGLDYDHGTGHGVGAFLNVHEGPFALAESARKSFAAHPLWSGMVTSIEPGYYREGWGGVRLENLYLVEECSDSSEPVLGFRCLTWIPFDSELVDRALLSTEEAHWFDVYQVECCRKLADLLEADERSALEAWVRCGGERA